MQIAEIYQPYRLGSGSRIFSLVFDTFAMYKNLINSKNFMTRLARIFTALFLA